MSTSRDDDASLQLAQAYMLLQSLKQRHSKQSDALLSSLSSSSATSPLSDVSDSTVQIEAEIARLSKMLEKQKGKRTQSKSAPSAPRSPDDLSFLQQLLLHSLSLILGLCCSVCALHPYMENLCRFVLVQWAYWRVLLLGETFLYNPLVSYLPLIPRLQSILSSPELTQYKVEQSNVEKVKRFDGVVRGMSGREIVSFLSTLSPYNLLCILRHSSLYPPNADGSEGQSREVILAELMRERTEKGELSAKCQELQAKLEATLSVPSSLPPVLPFSPIPSHKIAAHDISSGALSVAATTAPNSELNTPVHAAGTRLSSAQITPTTPVSAPSSHPSDDECAQINMSIGGGVGGENNAVCSVQLAEMADENRELRALAGAQESQLLQQETIMAALASELKNIQRKLWRIEGAGGGGKMEEMRGRGGKGEEFLPEEANIAGEI